MAFTIQDYRETNRPLVAIYKTNTDYRAEAILGVAIYRNMSERGGENLLVPVTPTDLDKYQAAIHDDRPSVEESHLPDFVTQDPALYAALQSRAWVQVEQNEDGTWSIVEPPLTPGELLSSLTAIRDVAQEVLNA